MFQSEAVLNELIQGELNKEVVAQMILSLLPPGRTENVKRVVAMTVTYYILHGKVDSPETARKHMMALKKIWDIYTCKNYPPQNLLDTYNKRYIEGKIAVQDKLLFSEHPNILSIKERLEELFPQSK